MLSAARQGLRLAASTRYNYAACFVHPKVLPIKQNSPLNNHQIRNVTSLKPNDNIFKRGMEKIFSKGLLKARLKYKASLLYEGVVDTLDYEDWFKKLQLVDSFNSWFIITELHLWMLMVRSMHNQNEGKLLRNFIVGCFWEDTEIRIKKMKSKDEMSKDEKMLMLSDQFNASIVSYDEGLLGGDIILAGAIWRRIFDMTLTDAVKVEALIKHIRQQINVLEKIPQTEFFEPPNIKWMPLNLNL